MKKSKIADVVRELIEAKPFLVDGLQENIINHSALARKFYPEVKSQIKTCSLEAIIIAIRRYAESVERERVSDNIVKAIASSSLMLKGGLVKITMKKNLHSFTVLNTYLKDVRWAEGEVLYVIQGQMEVEIITDEALANKLKNDLRPDILYYQTDINTLSVKPPLSRAETPGLYYYLFGILERAGVIIDEMISTPREILFVLNKTDAPRAYELVSSTVAKCRRLKTPTKPNPEQTPEAAE